jgi:hypothetical protein
MQLIQFAPRQSSLAKLIVKTIPVVTIEPPGTPTGTMTTITKAEANAEAVAETQAVVIINRTNVIVIIKVPTEERMGVTPMKGNTIVDQNLVTMFGQR